MKKSIEKRTTTNSSIYKKSAILPLLHCSKCPPNKGCNSYKNKYQKSWKKYRKTKWK